MKHYEDFEKEARKYPEILKNYNSKGKVFKDPNFHPNCNIKENEKVQFNEKDHIWERIDKYYTAPLFKKELIHPDAIQQGELGTCYFISSLSRIAQQPELVELLFDTRTRSKPNNKKKAKEDEFVDTINLKCGAVIVYFHIFGRLTPVLIDTLIPFRRGTRKPRFVHPSDLKFSPWFCLVEKAYAKLHGSYSIIEGGQLSKAIYNLFGYFPCYSRISSIISKREEKLKKKRDLEKSTKPIKFDQNEYLFSRLMRWQRQNAILGADIQNSDLPANITEENILDSGLVTGHSYLIMKVRREQGKNFICLRNPWGDREWLGDWSDTSPLWTPELKKALGVHIAENGTFWMIDKDFFKYFSNFDVAKPVNPEYHMKSFMTKLSPGKSDGLPLDNPEANLMKHQTFVFKLKDVRVKPKNSDNQKEEDGIKAVDDVKIYIRIEKNHPTFESYEDSEYAMFIVYSDGNKVDCETCKRYNRTTWTIRNIFMRAAVHIEYNNPIVIIFHRLNKRKYEEELYVQISCKYDFELYDADNPKHPYPEDEKFPIVFNNKSKRYSNISKDLRVKTIDGKDIQTFATMNTIDLSETFYKHLEYNKDSDGSRIYEYEITDDDDDDEDLGISIKKSKKKSDANDKSSKQELEKIIQKKKEVEELEKKVEKEKEKVEQEKKMLLQKKEEIEEEKKKIEEVQKESQKLQAESQKLEEEKKKLEEEKLKLKEMQENQRNIENQRNEEKNEKVIDQSDNDGYNQNDNSSDSDEIEVAKSEPVSDGSETSQESRKKSKGESDDERKSKKRLSKTKSKKEIESESSDDEKKSKRQLVRKKTKKEVDSDISNDSRSYENEPKKKLSRSKSKKQIESKSSDSDSDAQSKKSKKKSRLAKKATKESDDSESAARSKPTNKNAKSKSKKEIESETSDSESKPKSKTRSANTKRKTKVSSDSESESESTPPKRPIRRIVARSKPRKQLSEKSSEDESPTKSKVSKNKKQPVSKRKIKKDSDYSNSESEPSTEDKPKRVKRKQAPARNKPSKEARSESSESEYESDTKGKSKVANTKRKSKVSPESESDSGSESTPRNNKNRQARRIIIRNKRKIQPESESSDSEPRKKTRNQQKRSPKESDSDDSDIPNSKKKQARPSKKIESPIRRKNVSDDDEYSDSDRAPEARRRRPVKGKSKRRDESDSDSNSESVGRNQKRRRSMSPKSRRRVADDSDSDSDSGRNTKTRRMIIKRKSLGPASNSRQNLKRRARRETDSSSE